AKAQSPKGAQSKQTKFAPALPGVFATTAPLSHGRTRAADRGRRSQREVARDYSPLPLWGQGQGRGPRSQHKVARDYSPLPLWDRARALGHAANVKLHEIILPLSPLRERGRG